MNSKKAIRPVPGGWLFVFRAFVVIAAAPVLALSGCALVEPSAPPAEVGTISLERSSRESFLIFRSEIGEGAATRTIRFVIDTGAEVSGILDESAAGLTPTGAAVSLIGLHGSRLDGKVVRSQLRSPEAEDLFGDQQPVGAEMVVLPRGARLPGNTQALVGIDFLRTNASYLDVGKATLAAKGKSTSRREGVAVDLLRSSGEGGDLYFVACDYRGTRLLWLLDSGASQTLLSQSAAEKIGALGLGKVSYLVDSGGHRVAVRHSVLRDTHWGKPGNDGLSLSSLPVGITELPHLGKIFLSDGSSIDGVIGIDMLTAQNAIIDFQWNTLWLIREH